MNSSRSIICERQVCLVRQSGEFDSLEQYKSIPSLSVIASGAEGGAWQSLRMAALHVQEIATSLAPLLPRDDEEGRTPKLGLP